MNSSSSSRRNSRSRYLSLTAAVAAVLAGNRPASAQTSGAFTFSGDLGLGDSDALVGLNTSKTYIGAYNFGTGAGDVTVNGVTFTGVAGTNPAVPGVFSTTGLTNQHAGAGAVPAGQLGLLTTAFVYGNAATPEVLTYTNLVVGQTYVVSFYSKAWDTGLRVQNLTAAGASTATTSQYDQNTAPVVGSLNVLRYTFQAASTTQTLTFAPVVSGNTSHQYGFSLEQTFNNTWTSGVDWTASTWTGGAAAAPNSAGSNANFTAQAAPTSINLDAARTVGHIQFDGTNPWTIAGGNTLTLQADVGGAATLSALAGAHTITPNITLASRLLKLGAGAVTLAGNITGGTNTVQVGGGTLTLSGTNTYTGETIIGNGTLEVKTVSDYGVASAIGSRALADENNTLTGVGLHFQGGTLKFTGTAAQSTNRNIRILAGANGATIDASGATPAATLSFTKTGANINLFENAGTRTLTLTGTNTGDNGFSIPLINEGTSATSLTKSGAGTWVLNGIDANLANGITAVTNGTLKLAKTAVVAVSGPLNIGTGAASAVVQLGGTGGNQIAETVVATFAGTGATAGILRMNGLGETIAGLSSAAGAGIVENESGVAGTSLLTLNVTGTNAFSGILRDGDGVGIDGTLALAKAGAGTQTLSGDNTYTGATTLTAGVLSITHGNALGATTAGTTQSGASELRISGGITTAAEPISINGGGIINAGAIRNFADANVYAGTLTVAARSRIVSDSGTLTFSNPTSITGSNTDLLLSGAGDFVINGAITTGTGFILKDNNNAGGTGTLTLAGANTYSGITTVSAGTLVITGSPTGASNHVVNGATLRLDYGTNDTSKIADTASLTLGNATVQLVGGFQTEIVGSTVLTAGTVNTLTRNSGATIMQLNGVTVGAGAILNLPEDSLASTDNRNSNGVLPGFRRGTSWASNATNADDGLIVAYTGYTDVNRRGGVLPNDSAANVRIIEAGASGNVTLTAPLNVVNTLQVDAAGGLTTIAPTAATDVISIGSETVGAIWHQSTAGGLTIGAAANDGVLTTGNTISGTPATLTVSNDSTTNAVTINSLVANNGSDVVGLVKNGAGLVTLAGNNTFTGLLTAGGGTTVLTGNNAARPTGTNGITTVLNGAVLQLQANAGNTTGGISTVLGSEQIAMANQPLIINSGGTLQLRADSSLTFAGGNNFGGLGGATITLDVNRLNAGTNETLTLAPSGFDVSTTTLNVTGGNGYTLAMGRINNVAANATLTLNPTTASMRIGGYFPNATFATTLVLGGASAGNFVTGAVTNPATSNATTLTKTGASTWTLSGDDTYSGALTVSGGTLNLTGNKTGAVAGINVSNVAGSNATLNISNGTFALGAGNFFVGNAPTTVATGTVNQSGGAVTFASGNALLIGNGTIANTGNYNLSGGSITTFASLTRGIILGVNTSALSNFVLSGTGVLNMTAASGGGGDAVLQIGRYDSAANNTTSVFTQTGGTANVGLLSMGGNGGTGTGLNATLTLSGGTFVANQFPRLSLGNTNTSVINISGTADVTLPAFPAARGTSSTATVNFDGGTLRPLAASATYLGGLTNAFIKAGGAKFDVASGRDITVTQNLLTDPVSTGGGLAKAGAGILTLTGTSTYTGATVVEAGTLALNGSVSGSVAIDVRAGAILNVTTNGLTVGGITTLKGSGTIFGNVLLNAGAKLSPGASPGTLTFNDALNVSSAVAATNTGALSFELGAVSDQVKITTGPLTIGSGVLAFDDFVFSNSGGLASGTYVLFDTTVPIIGSLDTLNLSGSFANGFTGTLGLANGDSDLVLTVVPEPGSMAILLAGLGSLLGMRRVRHRAGAKS